MRVRAASIPGHEDSDVVVQVVETDPGRRFLDLSVDELGASRGPIVRGHGPPYIAERRGSRLVRVTAPAEMRRDLLAVSGAEATHLSLFRALHPQRIPVLVTGCSNLGMNPGVQAALPEGVVGWRGAHGCVIEVLPDGSGRSLDGLPPRSDGFALAGPGLLRAGRPLPLQADWFADPRHVLLFPFVEVRPGLRIDFGHDYLLRHDEGTLFQRALDGEMLALPLHVGLPTTEDADCPEESVPVAPEALREGLAQKGYDPSIVGSAGFVELALKPGIYPHHVLALRPDGRVASIVIGGLGNRSGVRVRELAEDLAEAGFVDALIVDDGGDVGLYDAREERFLIRPAEPDRRRAWPLTACLVFWELG